MNDEIGIFAEARRRAQLYAGQNETLRRKILGAGPAPNGACAETVNPFDRPRLPRQTKKPFWQHHQASQIRRRLDKGTLIDDLDVNPVRIVQTVARITGLTLNDLCTSPCREKRIARPRQLAIYLVARYCGEYSLPQLAYIFCRHHTTVMYAIQIVPRRIEDGDVQTRALLDEVITQLRQA